MNTLILNHPFHHPADHWYMIEPVGEHPHHRAGVVQVIDAAAVHLIVTHFNAAAAAGKLSHGREMMIDHEHFKHDPAKETIAYGWLQELQTRPDGIYGRIRWTHTGRQAVDGGDYRFFSTEYDQADLKVLAHEQPKRVRPQKLAGLTLTNDPNNKGGRTITNSLRLPEGGDDVLIFAGAGAPVAGQTTTKRTNTMKNIAVKLGLAAEAGDDAILAEATRLLNRNAELETQNQTLLGEQVDGILAECLITDPKIIQRLKPTLTPLVNRAERMAYLTDLGFKPGRAEGVTPRVLNRGKGEATAAAERFAANDEQARVEKIRNRASELTRQGLRFDAAWATAVNEANQPFVG